jgi:hypothetical protein
MYVKNLFLAKEGIATMNPKIAEIIIDITEIYIVVVKPLSKNFKFVNPSTLLGDRINHPNSWLLQEVRGKIKSKKNKFFTF